MFFQHCFSPLPGGFSEPGFTPLSNPYLDPDDLRPRRKKRYDHEYQADPGLPYPDPAALALRKGRFGGLSILASGIAAAAMARCSEMSAISRLSAVAALTSDVSA
jgi:hypothetical protein